MEAIDAKSSITAVPAEVGRCYAVVRPALLRAGVLPTSAKVGRLERGTNVLILEAATVGDQLRVRCAEGWTSVISSTGNELLVLDDLALYELRRSRRALPPPPTPSPRQQDHHSSEKSGGLLEVVADNPAVRSLLPAAFGLLLAALIGVFYQTYIRKAAVVRTPMGYAQAGKGICSTSMALSSDPPVHVFDEIFTAEESAHITSLAAPNLGAAHIVTVDRGARMLGAVVPGGAGVKKQASEGRTNTVAWLEHDASEIVWNVTQRIAALVGIPTSHAERVQIVHYKRGQEYREHYDGWDQKFVAALPEGQRLVTAFGYLNEVESGGETALVRRCCIRALRRTASSCCVDCEVVASQTTRLP
eukprot:SAG11_NODE_3813_length_2211_cov_2.937027_1_plen_360_part_00